MFPHPCENPFRVLGRLASPTRRDNKTLFGSHLRGSGNPFLEALLSRNTSFLLYRSDPLKVFLSPPTRHNALKIFSAKPSLIVLAPPFFSTIFLSTGKNPNLLVHESFYPHITKTFLLATMPKTPIFLPCYRPGFSLATSEK